MLETWINFGSGFLLVYSIDDIESFDEVKKKYEKILQIKGKGNFSCVIAGNKCDLSDIVRKVPKKVAEEYANSRGIPFMETSALNTINVKEAFTRLAHDVMEKTQDAKNNNSGSKMCGCYLI